MTTALDKPKRGFEGMGITLSDWCLHSVEELTAKIRETVLKAASEAIQVSMNETAWVSLGDDYEGDSKFDPDKITFALPLHGGDHAFWNDRLSDAIESFIAERAGALSLGGEMIIQEREEEAKALAAHLRALAQKLDDAVRTTP